MTDKEIINDWKAGLSKEQLSRIYKRQYNMKIKIIRSSVRHRHSGSFITSFEALRYVEQVIYNYLKK